MPLPPALLWKIERIRDYSLSPDGKKMLLSLGGGRLEIADAKEKAKIAKELGLDRPIIVAYLMLTVLIFVVINLVVDLLYAAIDPRVRLADAKG